MPDLGRRAPSGAPVRTWSRKTNKQHLDAMDGAPYETDQVVRAAGRLCALLLLSDKSGWSRRGPGSDEFPALSEAGDAQPLLKFALATKLFEGSTETGRRPRHRRIAEFLAARYLDHAIRCRRLTPTRALRLLQGIDGIVMPDLRGVSVWLAAMNPGVRRPLIEADPLGVAFQGRRGGVQSSRHRTFAVRIGGTAGPSMGVAIPGLACRAHGRSRSPTVVEVASGHGSLQGPNAPRSTPPLGHGVDPVARRPGSSARRVGHRDRGPQYSSDGRARLNLAVYR